jgi:predicted secreted hydrolase
MPNPLRVLICLALLLSVAGCASQPAASEIRSRLETGVTPTPGHATVARGIQLTGTMEGFERATAPRAFRFPEDFGPHPRFKLEWWYITGNVQTADARRFGYQITIFRQGLTPPRPETPGTATSAWRTTDVYLAHLAVTDVAGKGYTHAARLVRGGKIGLAGAETQPFRVWAEDWQIAGDPQHLTVRGVDAQQQLGLDLQLDALKPPVLQGNEGLSRKSDAPGSASYYFSLPRLQTKGTLSVGGASFPVSGLSWLDREWSTGTLGDNIGWDWFALHLDNGYDLMWYQLRGPDERPAAQSQGSLIDPAGAKVALQPQDMQITVLETWTSEKTKIPYPARWRLSVPSQGLELEVTPLLADQEIPGDYLYWEGAAACTGTMRGKPVAGSGYVELTGYAPK